MYVLDTDHCVELLRGNPKVLSKLKSLSEITDIYTTIITAAELFYGAHRLPKTQQRLQEVSALQKDMDILALDIESVKVYGQIKAKLAHKGELLADNDLFIASITLNKGFILVTHNTQHYARIPNLRLDDWVA